MTDFNKPKIKSAIPKRRYQYGEFKITLLDEIESDSDIKHYFIMAIMTETDPEPGFYLSVEPNSSENGSGERYQLRLIMQDGEQIIDTNNDLAKIDYFAEKGLQIIKTLLNLGDEQPFLID